MSARNGRAHNKPKSNLWGNIVRRRGSEKGKTLRMLQKTPFFAEMTIPELRELRKIMRRKTFRDNEPIFWEGEPGVGMYIVRAGRVGIYSISKNQQKEELAILGPGEIFGELALLSEMPRSATSIAVERTVILGLFQPDLFQLIARKPRLGNKFLFQLATVIGERLKGASKELNLMRAKYDQSKILL